MSKVAPYMKTVVAILGAVLTAVMTQFPDHQGVQQWGPIVSALLTAVAVYAVPNADPTGTHQAESTQPPARDEYGNASVLYILLVVAVVLVILALVGVI